MRIKFKQLNQLLIYLFIGFLAGFITAWVIRTTSLQKIKKSQKSLDGLLESERLVKDTLRKESALAFQLKESVEAELGKKLNEAQKIMKQMDQDILLLQKSNEESEALFKAGEPELYNQKIKLIEANNTIARMKAQLQQPNDPTNSNG